MTKLLEFGLRPLAISCLSLVVAFAGCTSNENRLRAVDGGTGGTVGSGGAAASGGSTGSAGNTGSSGLTGWGGVAGTGGVTGTGGITGTGGAVGGGGTPDSGGIGGTGGTGGSSGAYGMPCTTSQDCPSDAICCDGSNESCDGIRLPSGDGTNSGEFTVSADGLTVTDTITGLVWQRDGSGTREGCITDSSNLTCTWAEAKAYCASLTLSGVSGWRLPAIMELSTIVDFTRPSPSIDQTAFPNTQGKFFWTSSPVAGSSGHAWNVYFGDGGSCSTGEIVYPYMVRCVRGSRCYPTSRFIVLDGGLVRDALTNLGWQQQARTTDMTLTAAQTYCSSVGSGFRVPTVKELYSLVDFTVASEPMIDQKAFPDTPSDYIFWASSPYAGSSGVLAWSVDFSNGASTSFAAGDYNRVRCVR